MKIQRFLFCELAVAILLVLSSALIPRLGYVTLSNSASSIVFGPETFRREQGKPQTYVRRFSVNDTSGQFSLEVVNGELDDDKDYKDQKKQRMANAEIILNDLKVIKSDRLNKDVRRITMPVTLNQGDNTLHVNLKGNPVTQLSVSIIRIDGTLPPDLTPPRVTGVDPSNGATGVALNTSIRVNFSEPILLDSLTSSSFQLTGQGRCVSGRIDPAMDGTAALFTPAAPLAYSATYTLTVTDTIKDLAGNRLAPAFTSLFTTVSPPPPPPPDLTPPRVISVSPAPGSIDNQNSVALGIKFSEAIDPNTLSDNVLVFADTAPGGGSVIIQDGGSSLAVPNGERIDGSLTASADSMTASFSPTTTLEDGTTRATRLPADATITVVVLTRVKDLAGNSLDQHSALSGQQLFAATFTTSQFNMTGSPSVARVNGQASRLEAGLLAGDEVIVAGGYDQFDHPNPTADIYNRTEGTFRTVAMGDARAEHTTTVLDNGQVLIVGGIGASGQVLSSAELYDPTTDSFISAGALNAPRFGHSATLLPDGTVLIVGGYNTAALDSCEVFVPSGTALLHGNVFVEVPMRMSAARAFHTATTVPGGYVLIAGGVSNGFVLDSAEVFVPAPFAPQLGLFVSGSSPLTPWRLSSPRHHHTATALGDGSVLIAGGRDAFGNPVNLAEIFRPSTPIILSSFFSTGLMTITRANHSATALSDGSVLMAGGVTTGGSTTSTAETYRNGRFTRTTSVMTTLRASHAAVLLSDGSVLLTNGANGSGGITSAETFTKRR